ncbi:MULTISPECIES: formylglycine-generating enzyme family protein [unclassified Cobetia]|uniref:formylglycine-generating enzyme family protein n=1 Tax=unclassified Cobetia TaxID=2609414 RepID=UPI00178C9C06|nr:MULTISPECIES: SUMF1/EgtB/PvdO family nonheme iron enzyme [unclassified Cobetia]MBE2167855.1 SUMF1/EgtB/PvdO family nonheme iron enzyme [Cobetia sp. 2AS1]MDH2446279.1 SUMF1/EgtB/PvdO family nonheme iron enzyme [Cobetia sp. 2AS]
MSNSSSTFILAISLLLLSGCNESKSNSEELTTSDQEKIAALIKKTEDNMISVKGGTFQMGDFGPIDEGTNGLPYSVHKDNKPLHTVTLDSYSISTTQVSYDDFDTYTLATGKQTINNSGIEKKYRAPNVPAGVTWHQANDYCFWLSANTDSTYKLPTEAQWEFAARSRGQFYIFATNDGSFERGVNIPTREEIKNSTPANSSLSPSKIKAIPPNPLGIYQMGLNGFEWTNDWYSEGYYKNSPQLNPQGPNSGSEKVERGGGFGEGPTAMFTFNRRSSKANGEFVATDGSKKSLPLAEHTFRCISIPK